MHQINYFYQNNLPARPITEVVFYGLRILVGCTVDEA